jgi:two-component system, OmpR family, response regulator
MQKTFRILLAEDDVNMNYMLCDNLQMAGYEVDSFADGQSALSGFIQQAYDLCILDVMLPKKDGFTLATDIRKINIKIPLIFLTAKALKEDKIHGFRIGADDYITKPFSVEEFLLRIETILKRVYNKPSRADKSFIYKLGDIQCNFANHQLEWKSTTIELTNKEARLLHLFCMNSNSVISRDAIQKAIWEDEGYFVGRSLDVFISRLRKILSVDPHISIQNVHGVGYKLEVNQPQNDNPLP